MTSTIPRRSKLSYPEFVAEYLEPGQPVVITDTARHWNALNWTPEYFRRVFGGRMVMSYDPHAAASTEGTELPMRESIDAILSSRTDALARYVSSFPLHKIPELLQDVSPVHAYLADNWLSSRLLPHFAIDLFVGAPGATLRAIHHERIGHHGFTTLVYGSKQFLLWSPSQSPFMYPQDGLDFHKSSILDPWNPDLERYPLFAQAVATSCVLEPGETLFIPARWWHTSKVVSTSINIHHCFANETNWSHMIHELERRIRMAGPMGPFTPFVQAPNCCTRVPAGVLLAQYRAVELLRGIGRRTAARAMQ